MLRHTGSPRIGDTHTDTTTTDTGALLTSASLCLRLGELLSPEDAQLLSGVQGGTSDLLENVRSSKSHAVNHQVHGVCEIVLVLGAWYSNGAELVHANTPLCAAYLIVDRVVLCFHDVLTIHSPVQYRLCLRT